MQPMRSYEGLVKEIMLWDNHKATWIDCPSKVIPTPGRYVLAWSPEEVDAPLATPLFVSETSAEGFLAAPPCPPAWEPGTRLLLRGPFGRGFDLPPTIQRLALAALGDSAARLLPLMWETLEREASVALFMDGALPRLPAAVEVRPLSALPEALPWADFLALDVPMESLPAVRHVLGVETGTGFLPLVCQALVVTDMPCGGIAECGACFVKTKKGWEVVCKDGPVFKLEALLSMT